MHEINVRVRFCETDALGHINNTSYFVYLEEARVCLFDEITKLKDPNEWEFILASTKCDFISQGYFKQNLTIKSYITNIGSKSFSIGHEIVDSDTGKLIAKGKAVIVYFNFQTQKSEPIPPEIRASLEERLVIPT
ncbi:MAG TPA: thioesterase family protein [Chondromyces sp.]|nr:thioesterase family protein [Chondromyces sp.]